MSEAVLPSPLEEDGGSFGLGEMRLELSCGVGNGCGLGEVCLVAAL